jgi:hypothetical protein
LQPHNLVGHAFRSLITTILTHFGDREIEYEERVDLYSEFPADALPPRSRSTKIDIVARRGSRTVALLALAWRIRATTGWAS